MKPVHIDFCRRGETGRSSFVLWAVLLSCAALVVLGAGVSSVFAEKTAARTSEAQQLLADRASLKDAARTEERVPADVVDSVNSAVRMLDYPIIELMDQLERHVRPELSVVALEMGAVRTTLRIVVQAAAPSQALDFLDAIKQEPGFRSAALTRQEAANGDGAAGWRFTIEVPQLDAVSRASSRIARGQEQ